MNALLPVPRLLDSGASERLPSFQEAAAAVEVATGLTATQRRDYRSALATVARWLGQPPSNLRCSVPWLNEHLFERHPAAFQVTVDHHRSVCSRLRAVLRLLGLHAALQRGEGMIGEAWREFLGRVRDEHLRVALCGLARWCDREGIRPEAVGDAALQAYLAEDAASRLSRAASDLHRSLPAAWNKARAFHPDPAALADLSVRRKREPYTKPFSWFLPSFAADVERFRATIALVAPNGDATERPAAGPAERRFTRLYTVPSAGPKPVRRRLKPPSVRTRLFSLRQAAAALLDLGVPREEIRELRDFLVPFDRAADILDHCAARGMQGANLKNLVLALKKVAVHHVGLDDEACAQLGAWAKQAGGERRKGLTLKNRLRLAKLLTPATMAKFLHLPRQLMKKAMSMPAGRVGPARDARNACFVEVLTCCPMRLSNLRNLRLDRHFMRGGKGGRRLTHIIVPGGEVKTGEDLLWPLPRDTAQLLERYIRDFRPVLAAPDNPFLFPGVDLAPMSDSGIHEAFSKTVEAATGVPMNPHLARHFAAHVLLMARPGQFETASRILFHRSSATTRDSYLGLETDTSARIYEDVVLQARRPGTLLVSRRRPVRKPSRGGGRG